MRAQRLIIFFISIVFVFGNCQKKEIEPQNYFDAVVNNSSERLKPIEAYVDKGITEIKVGEIIDGLSRSIIINVNSDKPGKYVQKYDYKTGVSMSECGLVYEIQDREDNIPKYFKSIEGNIEITEINSRKRTISGTYNFRINSLSDNNTQNSIKGKFINISFKKD